MRSGGSKIFILIIILVGAAGLGWGIFDRFQNRHGSGPGKRAARPVKAGARPVDQPPGWRKE